MAFVDTGFHSRRAASEHIELVGRGAHRPRELRPGTGERSRLLPYPLLLTLLVYSSIHLDIHRMSGLGLEEIRMER